MKKIVAVLMLILLMFILSGCKIFNNVKVPEETTLEFWVGQNVDGFDFSNHYERFGVFGGKAYYGLGYVPETDENGYQIDPNKYVLYMVTSYPDYSSKQQCVTHIEITDPTVKVYGVTLDSSFEDFDKNLTSKGYDIVENTTTFRRYKKGKITISKSDISIIIRIKVTNNLGIIF